MATIRVEAHQVQVPPGAALLTVSTEHNLPIVFGCRAGRCGTCLVQVLAGSANFRAPTARETKTLQVLDARPDWRLACQSIVYGDVHLRYV
ncbi:2Fe-2S iron-sulfur cluster-binding protein [Streptomyces sp. NPDC056480]|uniref:2Fe-2S iron-sulfur cluster-binding protein n=1 Tax=Streptomyces sp. NPDC056480 TaxID=3345833 RepID=UPI0036866CB3